MALTSRPISIACALGLGFFLGSQKSLISSYNAYNSDLQSTAVLSPQKQVLDDFAPPNKSVNKPVNTPVTTVGVKPIKMEEEEESVFRLHEHIRLTEDPLLYKSIVYPRVKELLARGAKEGCAAEELQPYFDILKNIEENPLYYEGDNNKLKDSETCPVVFLYYFEGGLKMANKFFKFYSNIKNRRCLQFIVSKRYLDHPETREIVQTHGYSIVGGAAVQQGKTILNGLNETKKTFGDQVVVSVNDLDHLLVWFDLNNKPHRYSSYTDIVRLYVYELLITTGCPDEKNVRERFVVPCTCLMENNAKYISTVEEGIVWSEYGVTNRFHPTANFFLNKTLKGIATHAKSVGTVFANLRNMTVSFCLFLCLFLCLFDFLMHGESSGTMGWLYP
eukprot:jgi/Psemu1/35404/gm1.35404_g